MANIDSTSESLEDNLSLEKCFQQIVKGNPIEMEVNNIYDLLHYLQINMNGLQPKLQTILPFLLIHFMKTWPGWQKSTEYFIKEITYLEWFQKFKEYLSFKLNFIIKNGIEDVCRDAEQLSIDHPLLFGIDNSTQTDNELEKSLAPFSIEVLAPPRCLNTLVFLDGLKGDIILKEYNTGVEWPEKLTIRQLINWPNIEIEFNSKELHFKRCNLHEFQRFLGHGTYKLPTKKQNENCILEMDIIDINILRKSYSLNVIKEYCNLYINLLKKNQILANCSNNKVHQIEVILEDLILDLIDINKNSIATNTNVLFNVGKCTYDRNKSGKSAELVMLTDIITPNTLLSFLSFTAFSESENSFPLLNEIEKEEKEIIWRDILPSISYRCTFCDEDFTNDENIWSHLKTIHAMELAVMCFQCEQQFSILTLTEHRWKHHCIRVNKSKSNNINFTEKT